MRDIRHLCAGKGLVHNEIVVVNGHETKRIVCGACHATITDSHELETRPSAFVPERVSQHWSRVDSIAV